MMMMMMMTMIFWYKFIAPSGTVQLVRGGSSPKILGGRRHCPISPSSPSPFFSLLRNGKKYELDIGIRLKSVISRVANYVLDYTLRPVKATPEGPRWGWCS